METSNNPPAIVHIVTYKHEYGTDASAYATEALAWAGACKIIANWADEVEDHDSFTDLVDLINEGKHQQAVQLWSEMVCDLDIMEEITVDVNREVISEVVLPVIQRFDDEECTPDGRCEE